jgi:hypothetical protein
MHLPKSCVLSAAVQMFGKSFDELEPHDRQRVGGKVRALQTNAHSYG